MFKDTKSHGLVSIKFLSALNLFFGGDVQLMKHMIKELCKSLSLRTLSGEQQIQFDKISDVTAHINFKMKHSLLANMDYQDKATKTNNENVKDMYEFSKKRSDKDNFEREIVEDILKELKKTQKHHMWHQQLQMLQQTKVKLIRKLLTFYSWRLNLIRLMQ